MKDIILTQEELNNLKLLKKDAHGSYGNIMKYNDGVLKIYHRKIDRSLKRKLNKNIKRDSDIIVYPECFVYVNQKKEDNLKGTYMKKAPGIHLVDLYNEVKKENTFLTFDNFLYYYDNMFLKKLGEEDVLIRDVKEEQVFFDNGFFLTDSDRFDDTTDKNVRFWMELCECDDLYKCNLMLINKVIKDYVEKYYYTNIKEFDFDLKEKTYVDALIEKVANSTKAKSFNDLINYNRK